MSHWYRALQLCILITFPFSVKAYCFKSAGDFYHIDPLILKSVAMYESSLNQWAIHINRDKRNRILSIDYGLMQINSVNVPRFISQKVISNKEELLSRPCANVHIGASILASNMKICGVSWDCIGSYNAGFLPKYASTRRAYGLKVHEIYNGFKRHKQGR
jgi:soluble lytic murein transglycosylase-like protein